jgi:TPP-dependent pyruvate/acetoin dehydrogenase alpha subunit
MRGVLQMDDASSLFLRMYRRMVLIRVFEKRVQELFRSNKIYGAVHLYIGEEAVAVGVCSALSADDYVSSTHRGHGHILARGGDPQRMMAELYGKAAGYCQGKGGSMHIADRSLNILGANGIVGAGIPIATGAALSARLRGTDQVAVCFFGDAACNQGSFHESLNMAGTHGLPVVYVCENNLYGVFTRQRAVRAVELISDRASSYGFPGITVDGNDVLAVYEAARAAVCRARKGAGPSLIEAMTYRVRGHFEGDPQEYRTSGEREEWQKSDPIPKWETRLMLELGVATSGELEQLRLEVEEEVTRAVAFAEESPWPDPGDALKGAYSEEADC